jgi:hypothetical protein
LLVASRSAVYAARLVPAASLAAAMTAAYWWVSRLAAAPG